MKKYLIYGDEVSYIRSTCSKILSILRTLDARIEYYSEIFEEDFCAVVIFNDLRIAMYSDGTASYQLGNALKFAEDKECNILIASVRKGTHYNTVLPDPNTDDPREWYEFLTSENIEDYQICQNKILWDVLLKLKEDK